MASKSFLDNLTPPQRIAAGVLILIIGAVVAWWRVKQEPAPAPAPHPPGDTRLHDNRNIRFGMPAEARSDPASKDAYLIERPQYVLSYNDSKKTANWVSWNVNTGDIAKVDRPARFNPDPDLPSAFRHVTHDDYTGSGFDRGHLCPSKDRSDSPDNNKITFFTTNIVPQSPKCNRGGWERFESHCRDLTRNGSELYIAAGPNGQGGTGENGPLQTVGSATKVTVPAAVWKVVMVLPNKDATPNASTRTLAVWMPNDQTVPEDWKPYAVSIATVEQRTGYKFFPAVPDDVANVIKAQKP